MMGLDVLVRKLEKLLKSNYMTGCVCEWEAWENGTNMNMGTSLCHAF